MEKCRKRGRRSVAGFTLFELLIACSLIGVLAALALERLWSMQEVAEEAMAEQVVSALRDGVRIRSAELISAQRWEEFRRLPQRNPFELLEELPGNYRGELKGEGEPGNWYYDRKKSAALYFVKRASEFRASDGSGVMRFTVVGLDGEGRSLAAPPFSWLGVRPSAEYVWLGRPVR